MQARFQAKISPSCSTPIAHKTYSNKKSPGPSSSATSAIHGSQNKQQTRQQTINFEQIQLFSDDDDDDKSLLKAIELVEAAGLSRSRVCVISVISRDPLDQPIREQLVDAILSSSERNSNSSNKKKHTSNSRQQDKYDDREHRACHYNTSNLYSTSTTSTSKDELELQVTANIDPKANLIVLSLCSFLDTNKLISITEAIDHYLDTSESDAGLETSHGIAGLWPAWNQNLLKSLLILFILSHIVLFYNPQPSMDYSLIRIIKLLENLRLRSQSRITDLLETIASYQVFSPVWIRQARISCPRALFVCDISSFSVHPADLLTWKHELEDQIYNCLKKSNIIHKPSASNTRNQNSLPQSTQFATANVLMSIAEREDFVFVLTRYQEKSLKNNLTSREHEVLQDNLDSCKNNRSNSDNNVLSELLESLDFDTANTSMNKLHIDVVSTVQTTRPSGSRVKSLSVSDSSKQGNVTNPASIPAYQLNKFKKFIFKHINDIISLSEQQESNFASSGSSKGNASHPVPRSTLVLPRYDDFFHVLYKLKNLIFQKQNFNRDDSESNLTRINPWLQSDERRFIDIYDELNVDENFSNLHCSRIAKGAIEHYMCLVRGPVLPNEFHEAALSETKRRYLEFARGPSREHYLTFVAETCINYRDQNRNISNKAGEERLGGILRTYGSQNNLNKEMGLQNCKALPNKHEQVIITRRANGIKMASVCSCGRKSSYVITPADRKRKLERVDVQKLND